METNRAPVVQRPRGGPRVRGVRLSAAARRPPPASATRTATARCVDDFAAAVATTRPAAGVAGEARRRRPTRGPRLVNRAALGEVRRRHGDLHVDEAAETATTAVEGRHRGPGRRVAHERGGVDDVAARDDVAAPHDALGVWKKLAPTTVTARRGARGGGPRTGTPPCAPPSAGTRNDHDRGEKERTRARTRRARSPRATRGPSGRGRARAHHAPVVFCQSLRVVESSRTRATPGTQKRPATLKRRARATCSRRETRTSTRRRAAALDALLPGRGKADCFSPASEKRLLRKACHTPSGRARRTRIDRRPIDRARRTRWFRTPLGRGARAPETLVSRAEGVRTQADGGVRRSLETHRRRKYFEFLWPYGEQSARR